MLQKLYIKGMVCERCVSVVRDQLASMGLQLSDISLGEVSFSASTYMSDVSGIADKLGPLGFSILEDKKLKLTRHVKALVAEVYSGDFDFPTHFRFSELVSQRVQKDYDTISGLFSSAENITIEKYIIDFRVEKSKEFLVYTAQTLEDISFRLGFSSVPHLSRQFKAVTGFNPSHFRSIRKDKQRISQRASVDK